MTPSSASKLILALDHRRRSADDVTGPVVKRYRLARLNFDTPDSHPDHRYDYLKRTFD